MLYLRSLRKAAKIFIFLFAAVSLSGCYSLKTVPLNSVQSFPQKRKILLIHADDSLWSINNYVISGNEITGQIFRDSVKTPKLLVTNIYVAPVSAVKVENTRLTFSRGNIGKVDYYVPDWWRIVGTAPILYLLIMPSIYSIIY